jgi:hypothetical protein
VSNPFAGVLPAIIPFSGLTDANGNLTLKIRPRAAFWWAGKMVGKLNVGSAIWEAKMGGLLGGVGRGQRAEIAGLMVAPGDTIEISVISGPASVPVNGTLVGVQASSLADVAQGFSPAPNTIALDTNSPSTAIDRIDTATGSGSRVYPILPGTVSVGFGVDADTQPPPPGVVNRGTIPTQIVLRGYPSGFNYLLATAAQLNVNGLLFALLDPRDTQFSVAWTVAPGPQNDFIDVFVSPIDLVKQIDADGNLLVSEQLAAPAPWQAAKSIAPFSINMGAAGFVTVVGPTAGQTMYLHHIFGSLSANGAASGNWTDSNGVVLSQDTMQLGGPRPLQFGGAPLALGVGLSFSVVNTVAGMFLVGHVAYTKA